MANALIQLRIDERLKAEATDIYERLGLDLPTAIRIFLTRSVEERGIPFSMKLKSDNYKAEAAVKAMREMSKAAETEGIADMTLDEINAEISAVRKEV
ncbi:MAG: type II toxin-antitoxin system RelB/DinJ family antitoxin [Lachnospiraceae bacterium]|nr:type II toxin-antitoxin system RelB/DinJ family antitoxin [Lachnospiraceae bacterium]